MTRKAFVLDIEQQFNKRLKGIHYADNFSFFVGLAVQPFLFANPEFSLNVFLTKPVGYWRNYPVYMSAQLQTTEILLLNNHSEKAIQLIELIQEVPVPNPERGML